MHNSNYVKAFEGKLNNYHKFNDCPNSNNSNQTITVGTNCLKQLIGTFSYSVDKLHLQLTTALLTALVTNNNNKIEKLCSSAKMQVGEPARKLGLSRN